MQSQGSRETLPLARCPSGERSAGEPDGGDSYDVDGGDESCPKYHQQLQENKRWQLCSQVVAMKNAQFPRDDFQYDDFLGVLVGPSSWTHLSCQDKLKSLVQLYGMAYDRKHQREDARELLLKICCLTRDLIVLVGVGESGIQSEERFLNTINLAFDDEQKPEQNMIPALLHAFHRLFPHQHGGFPSRTSLARHGTNKKRARTKRGYGSNVQSTVGASSSSDGASTAEEALAFYPLIYQHHGRVAAACYWKGVHMQKALDTYNSICQACGRQAADCYWKGYEEMIAQPNVAPGAWLPPWPWPPGL